MRLLAEYLSTKVHARREFPKTRNIHTITEFLDTLGYKDIDYNKQHGGKSALELIGEQKDKSYAFSKCKRYNNYENIYWLRIYNGGEISKENPVYYMICGEEDEINDVSIDTTSFTEHSVEHPSQYTEYEYFDDFIDLLNENLIL